MSINPLPRKYLWSDLSLWILLLTNFITIFIAIEEGWSLLPLMWIYWFQSITIGFFNIVRILQLKEFSTENFKLNGQFVGSTFQTKIRVAFFFLLHYGLFHLGYFLFLKYNVHQTLTNLDLRSIYLSAGLFLANHLFSYIYNRPRDTQKQNIGVLVFYPYARIIPMHFTIGLVSAFSLTGAALPYFLLLKTLADTIMHTVEHRVIRKNEA